MTKELALSLLLRFLRGGVASAVSVMVVIVPLGISNLDDLLTWIGVLTLAGCVGFITGVLMTIDKYLRS